nr:flagellar assembly protein FliW [Lachnospiraceae bacterium]
MEVNTRIFGLISIEDDKLIHFVNGIVGFPELTTFALIHDTEKQGGIQWLQSMQEPQFAIPVMNPLDIMDSYNPKVEDELLKPIGGLDPENMLVLVTVTVPSDLTQMSVNLRGPIVINASNGKACQVITEGDEYQVKFPIYDIVKNRKAGE